MQAGWEARRRTSTGGVFIVEAPLASHWKVNLVRVWHVVTHFCRLKFDEGACTLSLQRKMITKARYTTEKRTYPAGPARNAVLKVCRHALGMPLAHAVVVASRHTVCSAPARDANRRPTELVGPELILVHGIEHGVQELSLLLTRLLAVKRPVAAQFGNERRDETTTIPQLRNVESSPVVPWQTASCQRNHDQVGAYRRNALSVGGIPM